MHLEPQKSTNHPENSISWWRKAAILHKPVFYTFGCDFFLVMFFDFESFTVRNTQLKFEKASLKRTMELMRQKDLRIISP